MLSGMADTRGSANDGFVRAIRSEIRGRGYSQKKFAGLIDLHETTLSGYLTGNLSIRTILNIETIETIAEKLGMDYVALAVKAKEWQAKSGVTPLGVESADDPSDSGSQEPTPAGADRRRKHETRRVLQRLMDEPTTIGGTPEDEAAGPPS